MVIETSARLHAAQTSDRLRIEFLFRDLTTCTRCLAAEQALESALDVVREVLEATGVRVEVRTRLPWDAEGIWVMNCAARCDDSKTRSEFGIEPRPLGETLTDTVQWLVEIGRLTPREAGRLG